MPDILKRYTISYSDHKSVPSVYICYNANNNKWSSPTDYSQLSSQQQNHLITFAPSDQNSRSPENIYNILGDIVEQECTTSTVKGHSVIGNFESKFYYFPDPNNTRCQEVNLSIEYTITPAKLVMHATCAEFTIRINMPYKHAISDFTNNTKRKPAPRLVEYYIELQSHYNYMISNNIDQHRYNKTMKLSIAVAVMTAASTAIATALLSNNSILHSASMPFPITVMLIVLCISLYKLYKLNKEE
jgi:hypothetical protein